MRPQRRGQTPAHVTNCIREPRRAGGAARPLRRGDRIRDALLRLLTAALARSDDEQRQ